MLFNRRFAEGVHQLRGAQKAGQLPAAGPQPLPAAAADTSGPAARGDALHVLAILQRDGRFIDFLQEDVAAFSDSEVGAAARAVHAGCKKAVSAYFTFVPVRSEPEGADVTVESGFDPARISLTGNVVGKPPFRGTLRHHGWEIGRAHV